MKKNQLKAIYVMLGLSIFTGCILTVFLLNYDSWNNWAYEMMIVSLILSTLVLCVVVFLYNKRYGFTDLSSKNIAIITIIGFVLLIFIQLVFIPWRGKFEFLNQPCDMNVGEFPLWNPPKTFIIGGKEILIKAYVDTRKIFLYSGLRFGFLAVLGIYNYLRVLKIERKKTV